MTTFSQIQQKEKFSFFKEATWQTFFQVLGASGLLALCSQIKIALPFTPIPLTLQTFAVLLIGATLGSRKGLYAILLYFAEILMGLPVLSGGSSNPLIFLGPKGGYVLGFAFQAYLMGWFVERKYGSKSVALFAGGLISSAVQMGLGILVLALFVGGKQACLFGLIPFLPGEILKIFLIYTIKK